MAYMNSKQFLTAILLSILLLFSAGCVQMNLALFGTERSELKTKTLVDATHWSRSRIILLDLSGFIDSGGSDSKLVMLKDRLDRAEEMSHVKGVILRINSPGGSVTASDVIHQELLDFKKRMSKKLGKPFPLYVLMEDVAASGGVYTAMAGDRIYALPTTTIGSIGVIATWPKWKGLADKIGFDMHLIKSADKKDMGSPWRDLTPEEQQIFQDLIDGMYANFLEVILQSRGKHGLTREALLEFADGRVFLPPVALEHKLIDEIAYLPEVIDDMKKAIGDKHAAVIALEYEGNFRGNIYARAGSPRSPSGIGIGGGDTNLLKIDGSALSLAPGDARFLYLWAPGR